MSTLPYTLGIFIAALPYLGLLNFCPKSPCVLDYKPHNTPPTY